MADATRLKDVEDQLRRIGCNYRVWGRSEIKELPNVLFPEETIHHCVNGSYEGGFAMLVATNQRVLLIDKKPMYLNLEDIRFDMIAEVDYSHRLTSARIFICTPNKSLSFVGFNHARLRSLFHNVQTRVMEIRQHYTPAPSQQSLAQPPSLPPAVVSGAVPVEMSPQAGTMPMPESPPALTPQPTLTSTSPALPNFPRQAPIVSAYTRLPILSRQRFLGARAMNTPLPSMYQQ